MIIKAILLTLLGLLIILGIARKCKSTKIFWILLLSFCVGFIGGSIAATLITNAALAKKDSCIKDEAKCTQVSCVNFSSIINTTNVFAYDSQSGLVGYIELQSILQTVRLLSFIQPSFLFSRSLQAFNPDTDIGYLDTS